MPNERDDFGFKKNPDGSMTMTYSGKDPIEAVVYSVLAYKALHGVEANAVIMGAKFEGYFLLMSDRIHGMKDISVPADLNGTKIAGVEIRIDRYGTLVKEDSFEVI